MDFKNRIANPFNQVLVSYVCCNLFKEFFRASIAPLSGTLVK